MKNLRKHFKYCLYLIVFTGYSCGIAGSYDDFFSAIKRDDPVPISQLIARGFDANTLGPTGVHGLLMAIAAPSPKVVEVLLRVPGIQVEQRNANDESALMLAAIGGMRAVCERLIAMDADVNKTGWTPLHYAASSGHDDIVRLLLEHYAYVDAESPNLTTPLMMAAMYGSSSTVAVLLDAGADPGLRNAQGLGALEFAQRAGRGDSAKLLAQRLQTK